MSLMHNNFININGKIGAAGYNKYGKLGLNVVTGIIGTKQISCSQYHNVLLMNDWNIKVCGNNNYGQLGLNDKVDRTIFTDVTGISNVK